MNLDLLQFEQTLHGYDNGHRLLASSLALDAKDERALLSMSDLSGPRAMEQCTNFSPVFTQFKMQSCPMELLAPLHMAVVISPVHVCCLPSVLGCEVF